MQETEDHCQSTATYIRVNIQNKYRETSLLIDRQVTLVTKTP